MDPRLMDKESFEMKNSNGLTTIIELASPSSSPSTRSSLINDVDHAFTPISDTIFSDQFPVKDDYCWLCHKEDPVITCITCPLTYHDVCLNSVYEIPTKMAPTLPLLDENMLRLFAPETEICGDYEDNNWICIECKANNRALKSIDEDGGWRGLDKYKLNEYLGYAFDRIERVADAEINQPFNGFRPLNKSHIIKPMTLNMIKDKLGKLSYKVPYQLVHDFKLLVHNIHLVAGRSIHKICKNSRYLLTICQDLIEDLEMCIECYENLFVKEENQFASPCKTAHLCVFCKDPDRSCYNMWPAKVMKVDQRNKEAVVRFFVTYKKYRLPFSDIFMMSKSYFVTDQRKKRLTQAIEDVQSYMTIMERRCPKKYTYYKNRTPFKLDIFFNLLNDSDVFKIYENQETDQNNFIETGFRKAANSAPIYPKANFNDESSCQSSSTRRSSSSTLFSVEKMRNRTHSNSTTTSLKSFRKSIDTEEGQTSDLDTEYNKEVISNYKRRIEELEKEIERKSQKSEIFKFTRSVCSYCSKQDCHMVACCSNGIYCGFKCMTNHWKDHEKNCDATNEEN